jgi:hypothetical protein
VRPRTRSPNRHRFSTVSSGYPALEDKQGDERNFNWSQIVDAAKANDISPVQVAENIMEMARDQS